MSELESEWVNKRYNIFSIFLATNLESLDSSDFRDLLDNIHFKTGEKIMCYFFIPQDWNIPRLDGVKPEQNIYNPWDLVSEIMNLEKFKNAILRGTSVFAQEILEKKIVGFPLIDKMGLLFFGKKEDMMKKDKIIYIPLSERKDKRLQQLDILFPEKFQSISIDYDEYYTYLKKEELKILKLLDERNRSIWINKGLQIVPIIISLIALVI